MMASPPHDHHHHRHHHQPKMLKPSTTTTTTTSSSAAAAAAARPPEHGIKCPRCDSSNTKFCYYNNYSLSQPRHFCKTCRRYWTKGGALRNVPVGGGCRKSKKSSSKSTAGPASYPSSSPSSAVLVAAANSNFSNGGFQLGMVPFSGGNQFIGFNYPIADEHQMLGFGVNQSQGSAIASSIESLSSINQDLHWKLQQQRLAMLFGAAEHKAAAATETAMIESNHDHRHHHHRHHDGRHEPIMPISFQGAEKAEICGARNHEAGAGASATGWFLESNGRINGNSSSNNNSSASEWNGIAAWSDMPQFSALP